MSIETMTAKAGPYIASGVSSETFPFAFNPLDSSYITVYVDSEIKFDGYQTTLNDSGGVVTFTEPVSSGAKVAIVRNVPPTQTLDLQNNTAFLPEVLERAYDKLTAIVQQLQEVQERSFVVPPTVSDVEGAIREVIREIVQPGGSGGGGGSGGTADYASSAGWATSAGSARWAASAGSAVSAGSAIRASSATSASSCFIASSAGSAVSAGYATRAGSAAASGGSAASAGSAARAGFALSAGYSGPFAVSAGINYGSDSRAATIQGGFVCFGGSMFPVSASSVNVPFGDMIYLVGSVTGGSAHSFEYVFEEPASSSGQFYVPIAETTNSGVDQIQYGNIVSLPQENSGGTMRAPDYFNLEYDSLNPGGLDPDQSHSATANGTLRISPYNNGGAGCLKLVLSSGTKTAQIGLQQITSSAGGITQFLTISSGTTFSITKPENVSVYMDFEPFE